MIERYDGPYNPGAIPKRLELRVIADGQYVKYEDAKAALLDCLREHFNQDIEKLVKSVLGDEAVEKWLAEWRRKNRDAAGLGE